MNRVLSKSLGGLIFAVATLLFIAFTASINAPQSMGGPMNMFPASEEWFYIVLVVDALLIVTAWAGIKLLQFRRQAIGVLSVLVGMLILAFGVRNHLQAPPLDGVNNTNMMPVPTFLHYSVYTFVGILLLGGAWLMKRPQKSRIR